MAVSLDGSPKDASNGVEGTPSLKNDASVKPDLKPVLNKPLPSKQPAPEPVDATTKEPLSNFPEPPPTSTNGVENLDPLSKGQTNGGVDVDPNGLLEESPSRRPLKDTVGDHTMSSKLPPGPLVKESKPDVPKPPETVSSPSVGLSTGSTGTQVSNGNALTTRIGVWDLDGEAFVNEMPPESAESIYSVNPGTESVIGTDDRVIVPRKDFMQGGKYRSIVKLFLRYAGSGDGERPWAMATGWLIRPDLLVTAGHCAFDWSYEQGHLTNVKAYIGYCGRESIQDRSYDVQGRISIRVATTSLWLESGTNKPRDVSYILLKTPFENVVPFAFKDTPLSGSYDLGVVGYPGDLMKMSTREKGACMYEMYFKTEYDILKSRDKMLEYEIDTFGGNSGSPVLRLTDMASIGVHVYGGQRNSASIINGKYGNDFASYIAAIDAVSNHQSKDASIAVTQAVRDTWLTWAMVPSNTTGTESGFISDDQEPNRDVQEDLFGFLRQALAAAAPIADTVLQTALPLALGPIGIPVGALAGVALNAAGRLAKQGSAGAESTVTYSFDGVAERAVLGEAALAAIVHLGAKRCEEEGLFTTMGDIVKKIAPVVTRVAPKVLTAIAEPALRIGLDELRKSQLGTTESAYPPIREMKSLATEKNHRVFGAKPVDVTSEAFIRGLADSVTVQDAESFLGTVMGIGNLIGKGLRIAAPILQAVAQEGLAQLASGTESELEQQTSSFDGLTHRVIVGEAALQALMQMPVAKLQSEGIFEIMKKVITTVGPAVIKTAPMVIKTVGPIVADILAQREESAFGSVYGQRIRPSNKEAEAFMADLASMSGEMETTTPVPTTDPLPNPPLLVIAGFVAIPKAMARQVLSSEDPNWRTLVQAAKQGRLAQWGPNPGIRSLLRTLLNAPYQCYYRALQAANNGNLAGAPPLTAASAKAIFGLGTDHKWLFYGAKFTGPNGPPANNTIDIFDAYKAAGDGSPAISFDDQDLEIEIPSPYDVQVIMAWAQLEQMAKFVICTFTRRFVQGMGAASYDDCMTFW